MDTLDKSSIEQFMADQTRCPALTTLEECYGYGTPDECPWKRLVKAIYKKEQEEPDG